MAARRRPEYDEDLPQAPLAPMIDVTFQILIFFIVTLKFPQFEGRLISHLPTDVGLNVSSVSRPVEEVRIVLCLDGNVAQHIDNRGRHDKKENWQRTDRIQIFVQRTPVGTVGDNDRDAGAVYREAANQAKVIVDTLTPAGATGSDIPPLKIDADSEVAFQHVIGLLNALQSIGVRENIQYVANPRLEDLLGRGETRPR